MGTRKIKDFVGKGASECTRVKLQSNFRLSVVCDAVWRELEKKQAPPLSDLQNANPKQKRRFFSWCGRWKPAP